MWDYLLAVAVSVVAYKLGKKGGIYYGPVYLILSGLAQLVIDAPMVEVRLFLLTAFGLWFFATHNAHQREHRASVKRMNDDRSAGQ